MTDNNTSTTTITTDTGKKSAVKSNCEPKDEIPVVQTLAELIIKKSSVLHPQIVLFHPPILCHSHPILPVIVKIPAVTPKLSWERNS